MARESFLTPGNLVLPLFLQEGQGQRTPIASMPGQARLSVDLAVELSREALRLGVPAVDLFPALSGWQVRSADAPISDESYRSIFLARKAADDLAAATNGKESKRG